MHVNVYVHTGSQYGHRNTHMCCRVDSNGEIHDWIGSLYILSLSPPLSLSLSLPLSLSLSLALFFPFSLPSLSFLILFAPIKLQTEWNAPHYPAGPLCNFNRRPSGNHFTRSAQNHNTLNCKQKILTHMLHAILTCMLCVHACNMYACTCMLHVKPNCMQRGKITL